MARAAKVDREPPAMPWNDEIAHWLLTTFRITGAWYVVAKVERVVEVGLGRGALADDT